MVVVVVVVVLLLVAVAGVCSLNPLGTIFFAGLIGLNSGMGVINSFVEGVFLLVVAAVVVVVG